MVQNRTKAKKGKPMNLFQDFIFISSESRCKSEQSKKKLASVFQKSYYLRILEIGLSLQYLLSSYMEKNYKFKYQSSKKALESINRYNYYLDEIIPGHFPEKVESKAAGSGKLKYVTGTNNLIYFWTQSYIGGELLVDEQSIMHAIKSTHLKKGEEDDEILKISQRSYQKISKLPGSFLAGEWMVSEIIEFVLKAGDQKSSRKLPFELYIIHHCQTMSVEGKRKQLKWLHYVQKYVFGQEGTHYEIVAVINQQKGVFGLYSNVTIFQSFIKSYMKMETFQGHMLKYQGSIKQKIKESEDPAFSEQHKLINQIPSEFIKMVYNLKKQFGADKEQSICRYLIARNFNLQETKKDLKQYLDWHEEMKTKYKWEDFEYFHNCKIFHYLGQDYKGRPVILNIAKNVKVDEMDCDKYCIYYMYFLEVFIESKMRGNVTQINIIADVGGIGQKNFKWAVTKQNIQDGKKYCSERQYKFFAVNTSSFAHFCYKFIKPLLPKKTEQKVYIGGNDKKEIVQSLSKDMSIDVIPTYMGGRNPLL